MNPLNISRRLVTATLLTASVLTVGLVGCSKNDRSDASATAKEAYNDSKSAMSNAWDSVKTFSFDRRNDFTSNAKALSARMEAEMSDLRANYSEAKASASRKAAMAELKNSEADYKNKVDALGNATAATWDSAKQNVIASWDHLQAAYQKARAD